MKNKILSFSLLFVFSLILVLNTAAVLAATTYCSPTIKLINQDPNPAIPDSYVNVVFEVSDLVSCSEGYAVKLNLQYPFSLDSNDSGVSTIDDSLYISGNRNTWMIPYKIRVASDALDGDYYLKLDSHKGNDKSFVNYAEQEFNITIQDSRTNFDAVIQEISGSDVSIAIANTGKYAANSVIVRIPEQDSFRVTGTNGQMVGNLESGDYTIVGFSVSPKVTVSRNATRTSQQATPPALPNLKVEVGYTDNIGERRVVNLELPLVMGAGNSTMLNVGSFAGRRTTQTTAHWYSSWILWIVILCLLIAGYVSYKKYPKQSKNFLNKIKSKMKGVSRGEEKVVQDIHKIPDWIRNAKEREKKK